MEQWPSLPLREWDDTRATLHLWTQIVGKIRMARAPMINHWWQVPLYVTARGLTTSPIPDGRRCFQIDLDFIDHRLRLHTSEGASAGFPLAPYSVAEFYLQIMEKLHELGIEVHIWTMPVEIEDPIPFEADHGHASYDPVRARRFWRALVLAEQVLTEFRGRFIGKVSPVHFFWGSFDLAVTRFSGRLAPIHPGAPNVADFVTREAYSHECSSCGFWPGGPGMPEAAFYSYAYPAPERFKQARVRPQAAAYSESLGEFLLPYESVRTAKNPEANLIEFLQSTYEAAAELGDWDRAALER